MDQQWVAQRQAENKAAAAQAREALLERLKDEPELSEQEKQDILHHIDHDSYYPGDRMFLEITTDLFILDDKLCRVAKRLDIGSYISARSLAAGSMNWALDSEEKEFDGDLIITDPCYIIRAEHHGTTPITDNDWAACDYGDNMEALGIEHYMTRDTLYGDWGCTVFDTDSKKPLGKFCADAGMVSVFLLDEILRYNPEYDDHIKKPFTATWIKNFKGTVQFVVTRETGAYEEESKWWHKGESWEEFSVHVVGHGIDKETGRPINFISNQTSL